MRAAWFLLVAAGVVEATLLQVGSPAIPLFGAAHVQEVTFESDWDSLRDLVMPAQYFEPTMAAPAPAAGMFKQAAATERARPAPRRSPLEEALNELGIHVGSAALQYAAEQMATAAATDLPLLITGETGTGKELFARLAHRLSPRAGAPFIAVNCGAIPKELVESYLFGHVKGAFTGATANRTGKFEEAHGGTLFLDEIGELPLDAQAKILRAVQEYEIEPVGGKTSRRVDVRLVAATNRDLLREVHEGRFRNDLYFRLEVLAVKLPALREQAGAIPQLALAILSRINQRMKRSRQLSKAALKRLEMHSWPGNIRELWNVLQRSVLYATSDVLDPDDIIITAPAPQSDPLSALPEPAPGFSLEHYLAQARKQLILRALEKTGGNQSAAAALLGISKQAIHAFLKSSPDNLA